MVRVKQFIYRIYTRYMYMCVCVCTQTWSWAAINTYTVYQAKSVQAWSSNDISPIIPLFLTFICPHILFPTRPRTTFALHAQSSTAVRFPHSLFKKGVFICFLHPQFSQINLDYGFQSFHGLAFSNLWAMCRSTISYSRSVMQGRALPFIPLCPLCTWLTLPLSHSCFQCWVFSLHTALSVWMCLCVIHDVCCSVLGRRPRWHL